MHAPNQIVWTDTHISCLLPTTRSLVCADPPRTTTTTATMSRSSVAALLAMALLVAVVAPAAAQSCTTNADCGGTQPACVDFFGELTCSSECGAWFWFGLVGAL